MRAIAKIVLNGGILRVTKHLYISVFSFFAFIFFVMGQGVFYSCVFISAILIHELSHIYFLHSFKAQIKSITIFPFGIDIHAKTLCLSYKKELICTLAGSFANLCFAAVAYCLFIFFRHPLILFFIICNFFLGVMNLIPLSFFDGGKAARLIIYDRFDIDTAFRLYGCFELFAAAAFFILSFFLIKDAFFNLSVILVLLYACAVSLFGLVTKYSCGKY